MTQMTIRYAGRVQGVGFRATVAFFSRNHAVVGRVCNCSDGTVQLIAQGDETSLLSFKEDIGREMARNIVSAQESWNSISGTDYSEFSIGPDRLVH